MCHPENTHTTTDTVEGRGRQEPVEAIHDRVNVGSMTSPCRWVEELAGRASLKVLRAASPEAVSFYEMTVHPEHVSAAH